MQSQEKAERPVKDVEKEQPVRYEENRRSGWLGSQGKKGSEKEGVIRRPRALERPTERKIKN